jgi:hypothetical protein
VDGVGDDLLDLLGEALLEGLGDLGVAGGVRDLAGLGVAAGVVDGVGELVLDGLGGLVVVSLRGFIGVLVVMLRTLSWTVPGTEDWVAWEAPWPFSLVRPEDMFVEVLWWVGLVVVVVVIVVIALSDVMRLRLIEMGRYLSVYLYLLKGTATYVCRSRDCAVIIMDMLRWSVDGLRWTDARVRDASKVMTWGRCCDVSMWSCCMRELHSLSCDHFLREWRIGHRLFKDLITVAAQLWRFKSSNFRTMLSEHGRVCGVLHGTGQG